MNFVIGSLPFEGTLISFKNILKIINATLQVFIFIILL